MPAATPGGEAIGQPTGEGLQTVPAAAPGGEAIGQPTGEGPQTVPAATPGGEAIGQPTAAQVLQELAAIAFCRITDYVQVENGKALVLDTAALSDPAARALVSIKEGTKGVEIKLGDKLRALELLGRCLGLFEKRRGRHRPAAPNCG